MTPSVPTQFRTETARWIAILNRDPSMVERVRTALYDCWPHHCYYRSFEHFDGYRVVADRHPPLLLFTTTTLLGCAADEIGDILERGKTTLILTSRDRDGHAPPLRIDTHCYLIGYSATETVFHALSGRLAQLASTQRPVDPGAAYLPAYLALASQEGIRYAAVDDIVFLESHGNYTTVHLLNGESRLVCRSLREFDGQLRGRGFLRVHQSFLINLEYVREYVRKEGGKIMMAGGLEAYLARSRRDEFFRAMKARLYNQR